MLFLQKQSEKKIDKSKTNLSIRKISIKRDFMATHNVYSTALNNLTFQ